MKPEGKRHIYFGAFFALVDYAADGSINIMKGYFADIILLVSLSIFTVSCQQVPSPGQQVPSPGQQVPSPGQQVPSPGQQVPRPEAVTFIGAESAAAEYKKDVCCIFMATVSTNAQTGGAQISGVVNLGSGFFAQGPARGTNFYMPIVTCDHVVRAAVKAQKTLFAGVDTVSGYIKCQTVTLFRDEPNDVAILGAITGNLETKNRALALDRFGDESSIVEGRGALIIGYPLNRGTEGNANHPIVRLGMIAQNAGGASFLLDGFSSHGNSGSPILALLPEGPKLVGMATGFANESINLIDENGALAASLPYNSGLATAVKASVILEALKKANALLPQPK